MGISSSSAAPPTYVLPTKLSCSIQPRPNTAAGNGVVNSNILSNRNLLFQGLDDTTESGAGDEIFKTRSFPSVKKLNLKVFNNLKTCAVGGVAGVVGGSPSAAQVSVVSSAVVTAPLELVKHLQASLDNLFIAHSTFRAGEAPLKWLAVPP